MRSCIVAAVDFSHITTVVMEQAAKETKLRPHAKLHLVHVIAPPIVAPTGAIATTTSLDMTGSMEAARDELHHLARSADLERLDVIYHVRVGATADEIIALSNEEDAELIVVGANEHDVVMRVLLGSTTDPLILRAPCSVLVARPRAVPEIEPPRADQNDDLHKRHHPHAQVLIHDRVR